MDNLNVNIDRVKNLDRIIKILLTSKFEMKIDYGYFYECDDGLTLY